MTELRPLLITYAYNILGTLEEARDVVQDAYLKLMQINMDEIEDRKAYLIRTVINLSINQKKRQKKIISDYPGKWLPEPVETEYADSSLNRKEVLSYSLMVLLEKLNARQRAVFILKEAFDYDHEQIADVLGITTENSRKLLSRARIVLKEYNTAEKKRIPAGYINKYLYVIENADMQMLEQMLAEEISAVSDGGGKAAAFLNEIVGRKHVMALTVGLFKKYAGRVHLEQRMVNHQPALFYYAGENLITCQIFIIENGVTTRFFFIRNPDKLSGLGRTASLAAGI
ncbi:MAG TPA: sigma-70 family RNA polymerase sigma factor [Chitinophagaceae bacterium]